MRPVKQMEIISAREISAAERNKIQQIFRESDCPFESLRNSVADTVSFDGFTLQIGAEGRYRYVLEI